VLAPLIGQEGRLSARPANRILELLQAHLRMAVSGDGGLPRICVHVRSGTSFTGWPLDGCKVDNRWILMRLESPDRIHTNLVYLDSNEIIAVEVQSAEQCLPLLSDGVLKDPSAPVPTTLELRRRADELSAELSKTLASPCELRFVDLDKTSSDEHRLALDGILSQFRTAMAFIISSAVGKNAVCSGIATVAFARSAENSMALNERELSIRWNARESTPMTMKDAIEAVL
jgi:hypothetical protein